MGITTEQYERIIRFLDAGMDPVEMDEFEKELSSNPDMRHQLDFEQSVRDSFIRQNITHLPGTHSETNPAMPSAMPPATPPAMPSAVPPGKEIPSDKPGKLVSLRKWLVIGAAAISACLLLFFFRQPAEKKPTPALSPQTVVSPSGDSSKRVSLALLFTQNFTKDAIPDRYPLYLAEALTDYEAGNYTTLKKLSLNNLPETRGSSDIDNKEMILQYGHYYKGLAFLQDDNTHEAITNLDWVLLNHPGKLLKAKTQWYLALAYLKGNEGEKAVAYLKEIVQQKDTLATKAATILDYLKK